MQLRGQFINGEKIVFGTKKYRKFFQKNDLFLHQLAGKLVFVPKTIFQPQTGQSLNNCVLRFLLPAFLHFFTNRSEGVVSVI